MSTEQARAVVIAGGVGGTSIAYHLTQLGWKEVILLERADLTSGSTFHSAGLVGQLRSPTSLTRMMMYGTELYRRLRDETGVDPGWHQVGSLRLASTPERMEELRRQAAGTRTFGLPLELIGPDEARRAFPLMSTGGVLGAMFLPTDGWLDPSGLALAMAAGARAGGASIRTQARVVRIEVEGGRVTGVEVEHRGERSTINAAVVVNAAGMFAPEIGRLAGVTVPIIPMAHQYVFTEHIDGAYPGLPALRDPAITYTQMLNARGGIEADFTVTRLGQERFLIVTGTAFGNHDLAWIARHLPGDDSVEIRDITSSRACLGLWGPRARDVLGPLTNADLGSEAFPYLTAQEITVGSVPRLALRVTYVGELGWELYPPAEYGRALRRSIWDAGWEHGLVAGGYRAIDALRLEKGYRVWSSDITPEESPDEAGLAFAVKAHKPGGFLGRDALVERRRQPLAKRLRCLVLDEPLAMCLGNEPVRLAGEICGRVTSGGYGFAVERSIAYAYLPPARSKPAARVEIDVFGEWIGARVERESLYDPSGERIRA